MNDQSPLNVNKGKIIKLFISYFSKHNCQRVVHWWLQIQKTNYIFINVSIKGLCRLSPPFYPGDEGRVAPTFFNPKLLEWFYVNNIYSVIEPDYILGRHERA